MNRRSFIGAGVGISLAALLPRTLTAKPSRTMDGEIKALPTIKPNRLQAGDKVGLIAPGWLITEKNLSDSQAALIKLGLEPVHTHRIMQPWGCFSNTDDERVADIHEMFGNPAIKGIVCVKGGYGCTRMLGMLNYELIRANPKPLIGFSDVTALVNAIYQRAGLVAFHGPVGTTIHRDYNAEQFRRVVMEPSAPHLIPNAEGDLERAKQYSVSQRYTIVSGNAEGRLAGGNLVLITCMLGTPYEVDLAGKIVCIEEIGEEPYRIDRMLTQLIEAGQLQKAAGIAFGICNDCETSEKDNAPNSFTLREVIEERIKPLGIPAAYGLSFGHNIHNLTLPIGTRARLDADSMTIELLDTAVV